MRLSRSKKRGSMTTTLFYVLFGLILAAFFIFGVFTKVKAAVDDSSFHKRFYSRDLALLVDALHTSNGDFTVTYAFNTPDKVQLDINLTSDKVLVTDHSDKDWDLRTPTSFLFGYNNYVKITPVGINRELLEFVVAFEKGSITFKFPQQDVVLPESNAYSSERND